MTSLGANCLAALYLQRDSVLDAHRAALDAIAAAGFGVAEISHPGLLSLTDAPIVRRHAEAQGLRIGAVHAPPMRRDPALARQREAAALAAELGAGLVVVHVSSLRFASADPSIRAMARERDLHRLDAFRQFCAPMGLTLGLENGKHPAHPRCLLGLLAALDGEYDEPPVVGRPVPPSATGLVFDSGHAALRGGDPLQIARTMLPRLLHTHLHDNHGARDEHLPPGQGRIDWTALLSLLSDGGYTGARLIELRPRRGGRPEDWKRDLADGRETLVKAHTGLGQPPAVRVPGPSNHG